MPIRNDLVLWNFVSKGQWDLNREDLLSLAYICVNVIYSAVLLVTHIIGWMSNSKRRQYANQKASKYTKLCGDYID